MARQLRSLCHKSIYSKDNSSLTLFLQQSLSGDYKRLVQVLANLLNNAAKYTPEGGKIVVQMRAADDKVFVTVRDNGIGIEKALLPNIFALFSQGERSSDRAQGGLGLGLSLVKSLVELHGGSVTARSDGLGRGSEFTICFPHFPKSIEAATAGHQTDGMPLQSGSLSVMVVDDNIDAAAMLGLLLEFNGHLVTIEHDPDWLCKGPCRKDSTRFYSISVFPEWMAQNWRAGCGPRHSAVWQ